MDMHAAIKDELERTETQRRATKFAAEMAGEYSTEIPKDLISQKLALKEALFKAQKDKEA